MERAAVTLATDVRRLPGVGPDSADKLRNLMDVRNAFDLLTFLPSDVMVCPVDPDAAGAEGGKRAVMRVVPYDYRPFGARGMTAWRVACKTRRMGTVYLVFFRISRPWLEKIFPLNAECVAEGKLERHGESWQMVHPESRTMPENGAPAEISKPFYALPSDVPERRFIEWVKKTLDALTPPTEWLEPTVVAQKNWPDWRSAMTMAHFPDKAPSKEARQKALERLAYDELFCHALALKKARMAQESTHGARIPRSHSLANACRASLPFALTGDQEKALNDIERDLAAPTAMMRLLQGDVGSGKTVVALLSMLQAAEAGFQATLMAPTELLARQHFALFEKYLPPGVTCVLLIGALKAREKREALEKLASGEAALSVGTHAAFQDDVAYRNQAYIVIDEQHRFGVGQRKKLAEKTAGANTLLMSATPIPRSLTLALYGDIDVSRIREKPAGRKPVETRALSVAKLPAVMDRVGAALNEEKKIYWICPLVEESEQIKWTSAETRHASLRERFGDKAALAHGKMSAEERDKAMEAFREGSARLLVATTVVEVGVDVPDATVIVIEHAERFGLSQLHQLRGRVGRSAEASQCLLLHGKLTDYAKRRLEAMRATQDGFALAEEDLRLRGAGDVLGIKQSGLVRFRMADFYRDKDLLALARHESKKLLAVDPNLAAPRSSALREAMELFRYGEREEFFGVG
ncbi:MAG: ATP-dependent DNA helicase RecG [Rickettsiales bacterium]